MRVSVISILVVLVIAGSIWPISNSAGLSEPEIKSLEVCQDAIRLFKQYPDSIWPGYDLSSKPFIFYMPERWVLLFNYSGEVENFTAYPDKWPPMHTNVLLHQGQLGNLAGQLSFDFAVDSVLVAAVPFIDKSAVEIFAFIVHENFHQFQQYGSNPAFGDIPWQREEKYPIEDVENTTMAYLEMELLMNCLRAMDEGDRNRCLDNLKQFTAVRNYRWHNLDPFIGLYEQGQEINEGTAAYVENKVLSLLSRLYHDPQISGDAGSLEQEMASFSLVDHIIGIFQSRITDGSISPEDMPRNRIYPVGATQGLLADYLGIPWKESAQRAGEEFSFVQLFQDKLGIPEDEYQTLLKKAKATCGYDETMSATEELIAAYQAGFEEELVKFEGQDGWRIEITLKASGIWRSRSSDSKKWLMEKGSRELRNHYNIYSLTADDLLLQLTESGLLEYNNWDKRIRTVSFFITEIDSLKIDGVEKKLANGDNIRFQNIKMSSGNLKFETTRAGTILRDNNNIMVNLI